MAFYQALKATGSPVLKAAYHPWIRGKENIPAEGPAILASNHNAVWDSVFLPMMLDREVVSWARLTILRAPVSRGG